MTRTYDLLLLLCCIAHTTVAVREGDLRLQGTSSRETGRLEVYIRGEWGTVCDNGFFRSEAIVACRQLGYTATFNIRRFGNVVDFGLAPADSPTRIWLDHVDCNSVVSTHLLACGHSGAGVVTCSHAQDVALECSGPVNPSATETSPPRIGDLRLFGSSSGDIGQLQIYFNGEWGSVCGQRFGKVEADVACRQLGFSSATKFSLSSSDLGTLSALRSEAERWLDVTQCGPSDQTLLTCAHRSAGSTFFCQAFQDVSLECASINSEGDLRLVGDEFMSNRLEIYLRGEWGTVCSHGFGEGEAEVACKQLGYSSVQRFGAADSIGAPFFSPDPPVNIWLSNVNCGCGDEELLSCDHSGIGEGVADCTHSDNAALVCSSRITDESAISCSASSTVIAVAVVVPISVIVIFLLICTIYVAKSRHYCLWRHPWQDRTPVSTTVLSDRGYRSHTHQAPPSQTQRAPPQQAPPSQTQQAPPFQSQQAPPSQSFPDEIPPNSTLQEAPPPAYEQGINYPSPSSPEPPPPPYHSSEPSEHNDQKKTS